MDVSVETAGRVAVVRIDRGDGLNALSAALMRELTETARAFEGDTQTSVVILTGTGTIFTAGLDLKDPANTEMDAEPLHARYFSGEAGARMTRAWAELEPVTIAAIEGPCMGGGVALTAMCDFRIGAEGSRFATPEIRRGLNMAWHSVPRLVAIAGTQTTRRLVLAGHELNAEDAFAAGLIDAIAERGKALESAREWAEDMASACPPVQLRMAKRQIANATHGLDVALSAQDRDQFLLALGSDDAQEAFRAFQEKRTPVFKGE